MATIEDYREYRNTHNKFGVFLGAVITEMKLGYATCEMPVKEVFSNPNQTVHGGVIFAIGDMAAGSAAASYGLRCTTVDTHISFLAPALHSKMLYSEAVEVKRGKTISVYDVRVTDETKKLIAKGTYTFFNLGTPILPEDIGVPGAEKMLEFITDREGKEKGIITDHGSPVPDREGEMPRDTRPRA